MYAHKRIKASFCEVSYPADRHPLHVRLCRPHALQLGISNDKHVSYLSIVAKRKHQEETSLHSASPASTPILGDKYPFSPSASYTQDQLDNFTDPISEYVDVTAFCWIIDEQCDIDEDTDEIQVECSDEFVSHYQLDEEQDVYVRCLHLFPIQKVVIGVTDYVTFKWLQKIDFSAAMVNEVCKHAVLLKVNDIFLAPYPELFFHDDKFSPAMYYHMHILECCPLRQGILSVDTELVLSYIGDKEPASPDSDFVLQSPTKAVKTLEHFLMSDFCQPLKPTSLDLNAKTIGVKKSSYSSKIKNNLYGFEIVQQHVLWRKLLCKVQKKTTFDPMYIIGVSKINMLQSGFFEETLVKVSLEMSNSTVVSYRLALVKCLSDRVAPLSSVNKVYVSPLLIFNLQNSCGMVSKKVPCNLKIERYECTSSCEHEVDFGSISSSWNTQIPTAKEVSISIVISPYYSPRQIKSEAMKAYFRVPRLLTKGDILPVRSQDDPEFCSALSDSDKRFPTVFFKVVKLEGPPSLFPSFICDHRTTRVVQVGSVHSYVPLIMNTYLSVRPLSYWDQSLNVHGMNRHADQLEILIRPYLQHRMESVNLRDVLPSVMLTGPSGCGKTTVAMIVARRLNMNVHKVNCHSLYGESSGSIEARIKNVFNAASTFSPCILLLHSIHALGKDKERNVEGIGSLADPRVAGTFKSCVVKLRKEYIEYPVVVIGTTHSPGQLAADVHEAFLHKVNIEVPNEDARAEIMDGLLQNVSYSGDLSGQYLAQRTAGFVLGDLVALVAHAKREAYRSVLKHCMGDRNSLPWEEEEDIASVGTVVQQDHFVKALDQLQEAHSDTIGAPKIPDVSWDDVGGLADVKSEILDTIQLPLQYPELLAAGLRRSGILFYGPPGTGKTLLAKAIATECSLNFLSVKGPELINMYVGQSEQNVRDVFERARSATPCVIFFDELDSLAPNRGRAGDSGGVMDRVVSQLLAELDGLNKSCDVFVIGATNRPDLLDPALLRPGRFDKMLYLGIPEDKSSKLNVLKALTRRFQLAEDVNLDAFAERCPSNLTGADFYALCSDAMLNTMKCKIQQLEAGESVDETVILVSQQDFDEALENLTPSLTDADIQRYCQLRDSFSNDKDHQIHDKLVTGQLLPDNVA
ncbi:peroxisomal ATPase PEX6-like isoform X1 [Saccostrea echinata]|uniref:peroxisomal ATPase PEX6-like isoform X1 n=1 Tax=Saccostrea echinata TaxID=191078 RepID=UPI002A81BB61|nr:peroxisomal ATPase PEX6-like isoform X1 [Saccostrea echinata]